MSGQIEVIATRQGIELICEEYTPKRWQSAGRIFRSSVQGAINITLLREAHTAQTLADALVNTSELTEAVGITQNGDNVSKLVIYGHDCEGQKIYCIVPSDVCSFKNS